MASILEQLKDLRTKRKKLAEQTNELVVKVAKENRAWTAAENAEWEARHKDIDALGDSIKKLEQQGELESMLGELPPDRRTAGLEDTNATDNPAGGHDPRRQQRADKPDQWQGLRKYLLYGGNPAALSPSEQRHFLFPRGEEGCAIRAQIEQSGGDYEARSMGLLESRAMGGSSGAGDAMIPQGFVYTLNVALKWYGGIISPDVCTYIDTTLGNQMPYPNVDDTGNTGETTAENSTVTGGSGSGDVDPTFSAVTFNAWMYDSGVVLVPIQLIQDAAFNVEDYLVGDTEVDNPAGKTGLLPIRIGRKLNADCTTGAGSGSSVPKGIVTAATLGVTGASNSAVTYSELVDLEHSVDPAYRGSDVYGIPNAKFMFNDTTLKAIKKLVDGNSRPLWIAGGVSEGVQNRRPDMVDGFKYVINQDMASIGSTTKAIIFGDLKKYVIRRVRGLEIFTFRERYMSALQLGFLAYQRFDGNLLTAGSPVKYWQAAV